MKKKILILFFALLSAGLLNTEKVDEVVPGTWYWRYYSSFWKTYPDRIELSEKDKCDATSGAVLCTYGTYTDVYASTSFKPR